MINKNKHLKSNTDTAIEALNKIVNYRDYLYLPIFNHTFKKFALKVAKKAQAQILQN